MTDSPTLVLLTNRYPFGTGEEYLEQEIQYLSAQFVRIIVVPCMPPNTPATREVPHNVEVVRFTHPDHRRGLPKMLLSGLRAGSSKSLHPVKRAYDSYFMGRSEAIADACEQSVRDALRPDQSVVIYSYWFYVTAMVGALLRERLGLPAPLISRAHGYDVNVQASPVKYLPHRETLLTECDRVHPVSDRATAYLSETYPQSAHKVSTRRLGTSTPEHRSVARQHPLTVVTCSMIRPLKRLHVVGEAIEMLRRDGVDARWVHLGSGSNNYAAKLRSDYAEREYVGFRGYVPNAQIFDAYREIQPSVLVNASTSEGVPVSAMEAMACGVPVLATDVGGTSELLGPDITAVLPVDLDPETLARIIRAQVVERPADSYQQWCAQVSERWGEVASAEALYPVFAAELSAS